MASSVTGAYVPRYNCTLTPDCPIPHAFTGRATWNLDTSGAMFYAPRKF